jgi:hypothetical protein
MNTDYGGSWLELRDGLDDSLRFKGGQGGAQDHGCELAFAKYFDGVAGRGTADFVTRAFQQLRTGFIQHRLVTDIQQVQFPNTCDHGQKLSIVESVMQMLSFASTPIYASNSLDITY